MSVSGIDFGNQSLLIGQTTKGGVDVILNGASNRQTATYVSIKGKQRFFGDAGAAMARTNIAGTISMMKLLVGRRFDDPAVQEEVKNCPFKCSKMAHGGIGIHVTYKEADMVLAAEHVLAMMLKVAKKTSADANQGVNLSEATLAVPNSFTDAQRRGLLSACEIADLNCLKVCNESTNIALSYGFFKSAKSLFSTETPTNVMFVDIGYVGIGVSIVSFVQDKMQVLSSVYESNVAGREFDNIIIEYCADAFQKKYKTNVRGDKKAMLKLEAAAEKAKKTLSPFGVTEAPISVECLANDTDLNCVLVRTEFEDKILPIINRYEAPMMQALHEAGLTPADVSEVELIGGSTRINLIKRRLAEMLGFSEEKKKEMNFGLKTTMNSDEAVARGGALQCAMLSAKIRVKPFTIIDRMYYGVVVHYEGHSSGSKSGAGEGTSADGDSKEDLTEHMGSNSAKLYSRNDEVPRSRRLTFRKQSGDLKLRLCYDDEAVAKLLPRGECPIIAEYQVKVPPTAKGDVRITFDINKHGCVFLYSAQLLEELPPDEAKAAEDATETKEAKEKKEAEKEAEMKVEGGEAATPKKKYKKIDLEIKGGGFSLSKDQIKEITELENTMENEDRIIKETSNAKNKLESYIYAYREKVDDKDGLKNYCTEKEGTDFKNLLSDAEDWLYGDGDDVAKSEYNRKLDALQIVGNRIEFRFADIAPRLTASEALRKQIDLCKSFCQKQDEDHAHITDAERTTVRDAAQSAEAWLFEMLGKQGEVQASQDPVLKSEDILKRRQTLHLASDPIFKKPKPKPAPTPVPAAAPASTADTNAKTDGASSGSGAESESASNNSDRDANSGENNNSSTGANAEAEAEATPNSNGMEEGV